MQFSVAEQINDDLQKEIILTDFKAGTSATILPSYGALLKAFTIKKDGKEFNVIDFYKDLNELRADLSSSFKSAKLSPFACRIRNGMYTFEGAEYNFENKFADGNAIHGLLYNKPFKIVSFSEEEGASATFTYTYNQEDKGYPYVYRCEITYTLKGSQLAIKTIVTNEGDQRLPLSDGWHPYFTLKGKVNDWTLSFPRKGIVEFDASLIPTGELLPYHPFEKVEKIGEAELDNSFVLDEEPGAPAPCIHNPANGLFVKFHPDEGYPYFQVYIPPARNSIAVENLSGAPNCFNNGMGLIRLEPHKNHTFRLRYELGFTN